MKKKIIMMIMIAMALSLSAVIVYAASLDSNEDMMDSASEVYLDTDVAVDYSYDAATEDFEAVETLYSFQTFNSGVFTFALSGIDTKTGVTMFLMDETLSDYLQVTNKKQSGTSVTGNASASGSVFLTEGKTYYISMNVESLNDAASYAGSFNLKVTDAQQQEAPVSLSEGSPALIEIANGDRKCLMMNCNSTAYYRIESKIMNCEEGFSTVCAVTDENGTDLNLAEGICKMEQDKIYYVWIFVDEISKSTVSVEVRCSKLDTASKSSTGSLELNKETNIDYKAEETALMVVYSESTGDPRATIYDTGGFNIGNSENANGTFSSNAKDFALVFGAEKGKTYKICIEGNVQDCKVNIVKYNGDGSTLNKDDIKSSTEKPTNTTPTTNAPKKKKAQKEVVDLPAVKIAKLKAGKKKITVKWKKISKSNRNKMEGLEICVTGAGTTKTVNGNKNKTSTKIGGLKSKKKYTVKIRAYQYRGTVKHVSAWSSKKIKVK